MCNYRSGYYSAADFLDIVPELTTLADIDAVQLSNISSTAIDVPDWFNLKAQIEQCLLDQDAVVITQGTNTLEETAFFSTPDLKHHKAGNYHWRAKTIISNGE